MVKAELYVKYKSDKTQIQDEAKQKEKPKYGEYNLRDIRINQHNFYILGQGRTNGRPFPQIRSVR